MDYSINKLPKFEDNRGFLIEFLKNSEMKKDHIPLGQIYLTTIKADHCRGNHFHRKKDEFFCLMQGKAMVILEDVDTGEREELELTAEEDTITRIRVGSGTAHVIKNISQEDVILCSYSNKEYNPASLDQNVYKLL